MKIITVGFSPVWDVTCTGEQIKWGSHQVIDEVTSVPAGKALNICKALAWMGKKSTACGLWGELDWERMVWMLAPMRNHLAVRFTKVAGNTRQNVTIIDRSAGKEMHLRSASTLATKSTLAKLEGDLKKQVTRGSLCVFAGAFVPSELEANAIKMVKDCKKNGARVVVDSSGAALKAAVASGCCEVIKPNVAELRELLGERIADRPAAIIRAARQLNDKVRMVLVSRGENGAMIISKEGCWSAAAAMTNEKVLSTVACGDYFLAGFLEGLREKLSPGESLAMGIKVATARALKLTDSMTWSAVNRDVKVHVEKC